MIVNQILIVVACAILFLITFILNRKTKVRGEDESNKFELPDNCMNCSNKSCLAGLEKYKKEEEINKIIEECPKGEKNNEE